MDNDNATISVQIYKNSMRGVGVKVHLRKQQTKLKNFLEACSSTLGINAKIVFDCDGKEIRNIGQLESDKDYYISEGEKYSSFGVDSILGRNESFQFRNQDYSKYSMSILGAGSVGKSNVTLRYVKNEQFEFYDTTLQDDYTKKTKIDGKLCEIKITDTAGMEEYYAIRTQWMKNRDGLIFLYSIDSYSSFLELRQFLELWDSMDPNPNQPTAIAIVGNKMDLESQRQVSADEGQVLATKYQALFLETSAKTAQNIEELFLKLMKMIFINKEKMQLLEAQRKFNQKKKKKSNGFFGSCYLI